MPHELRYIALIFALFVVSRALQRFRLPAAITNLGLGALSGMALGWFTGEHTIDLLSTFGIVALFLFAGLEVDAPELRANARFILQHLILRLLVLIAVGWAAVAWLGLEPRAAALVALALLTPSTGFILESLGGLGLASGEQRWIKAKAIASELLALVVLFVVLQSSTAPRMGGAALALLAIVALLPLLFRVFAKLILPYAPKSEFAFLMMMAIGAAYATKALGAYYLVGAFLVGIAAQQFRARMPALGSEKLIHGVELFASFFVPFYFFHAGLRLQRDDFGPEALLYGIIFSAILLPLRLLGMVLHRRLALGEPVRGGLRIAFSLLPTLVFTLVLAEILRERFHVPEAIFGGLIIYTLVNTLIPGLVLRLPQAEYRLPLSVEETLSEPYEGVPPAEAGGRP